MFNILRIKGQNLTKFYIHIIIDKIYVGIVNRHFFPILKFYILVVDIDMLVKRLPLCTLHRISLKRGYSQDSLTVLVTSAGDERAGLSFTGMFAVSVLRSSSSPVWL